MGATVIGGLGPGLGQSINPFDPDYVKKLTLSQSEQPMIDKLNADAKANYLQKAHDYLQQNISLQASGQPLLHLDPPPFKIVLDGQGGQMTTSEYVTPPLSVIPPVAAASGVAAGAFPKAAAAAVDRTDQLIAMIMILKQDLEVIKAKLGV